MAEQLPEFVYLVTVDGEWPVSAIALDNPGIIADVIEREIERRNPQRTGRTHVWFARLTDIREVDLIPAMKVKASIRERDNG